jgi:stress response protein SCP2
VLTGSLEADYTSDTESEPDPSPYSSPADPVVPDEVPHPTQTIEQQELIAGQNVPLAGPRVQVDLVEGRADLSVLLVGASGHVDQDEDFVFYNNPRDADGAVTLNGNIASIDTVLLPQRCERLVLVLSAGDGDDSVSNATAVLHQPGGATDFRFRPAGSSQVGALVWGELYLRDGSWRLRAVGQGWTDGLGGLARDYGVDVD